ncbi:unnamed protein product [Owenia fusiformis]|uniref:Uncharacterized protein n=1 Tax=Owenia fusiformis TaxID=6347 RepID=A0A8J1TA99_OWEFU|nr:unnamed protein product [Owenia fusiformis]
MIALIDKCTYILGTLLVICVGLSLGGQGCPNLPRDCYCDKTFVNCSRMGISKLPAGIPRNTTTLIINMNSFSEIPNNMFSAFPELQQLDISSNQITSGGLYPGSFAGLPKLSNLDLGYNYLDQVPKGLPKTLTYLYLLQTLNSTTLAEDAFKGLKQLQHLDISFNKLESLPRNLLKDQSNLQLFRADWNPIPTPGLPDGIFLHLTKLGDLSMRGCKLSKMIPMLPKTLQNLDVAFNQLTYVPVDCLAGMHQLQTLAFWNNSVTGIADGAFRDLESLTIFDATSCALTTLTDDTFKGLVNVKTLYIDENKISNISANAFAPLKNLDALWMTINSVAELNMQTLNGTGILPKLSTAYLWANPWKCDCHLRWLREMVDVTPRFTIDAPHLMICHEPPAMKGKTWDTLKPSDFKC